VNTLQHDLTRSSFQLLPSKTFFATAGALSAGDLEQEYFGSSSTIPPQPIFLHAAVPVQRIKLYAHAHRTQHIRGKNKKTYLPPQVTRSHCECKRRKLHTPHFSAGATFFHSFSVLYKVPQ